MPPERFALLRRVLTGRLITALIQLFNGLGSWHRSDAQRFAAQAIPMVEGAQTALANLTSTYVASAASQALRTTVAPPAIPRGARLRLRQVDPQEVYQRPFVEAYTALGDGKSLGESLGHARLRLREVAEGDLQQTYAESSRAAMQNLREDQRPSGWRRVLQGDESCALCTVASTQSYTISDLNPIHPNCIPAGSTVRVGSTHAATRRWYAGELTIITTSFGEQFTVTPNHPVLTDRGWVPGYFVREGDRVVRSAALDGDRLGPYEQHRPALVEDVWSSLDMTFRVGVMQAAEDFHGDGTYSEVDVIRTDRDLSSVRYTDPLQPIGKRLLESQHLGRSQLLGKSLSMARVPTSFGARISAPCWLHMDFPLFGSHGLGAEDGGSGAVTDGHTPLSQYSPNDESASAERTTKFMNTGSTEVFGDYLVDRNIISFLGFSAARYQSSFLELLSDSVRVNSHGGSDVIASLPRGVQLTDVVRTDRTQFRGHVYNFQTAAGYYETNSHIVHNCDCIVQPIYGPIEDRVIDPELLEKVHDAVFELTGVRDRGGRAVDYRKILISMTHDHGELGPMLARPQDRFTTVADLPARRS